MDEAISDVHQLLCTMEPILNDGVFVFASVPSGTDLAVLNPIATILEREGLTVVVPEASATAKALPVLFRAAWITLQVHSDLQAVGLTAAFAGELGRANISCNVIAGAFHDHIFVPVELANKAVSTLVGLQLRSKALSGAGDQIPEPLFGDSISR